MNRVDVQFFSSDPVRFSRAREGLRGFRGVESTETGSNLIVNPDALETACVFPILVCGDEVPVSDPGNMIIVNAYPDDQVIPVVQTEIDESQYPEGKMGDVVRVLVASYRASNCYAQVLNPNQ